MILVIDNFDSFTYNLVDIFQGLEKSVKVVFNNQVTISDLMEQRDQISAFVFSPGPGHPKDAAICYEIIKEFSGKKPILGVCLGHQVICEYFGAKIVQAQRVMHGKVSSIQHNSQGLFSGLSQDLQVNRYHSLIAKGHPWPEQLAITAWTDDLGEKEIMGVQHQDYPIYGVQFHPESVLSQSGAAMIKNFILCV